LRGQNFYAYYYLTLPYNKNTLSLCPYKYFFRRIKMEVILAIIAVAVVAGLLYKFVSIRKDAAVHEFPTTQPEAAPYKVEPAKEVSAVAPKKVDKLEVVTATKPSKAKPKAPAKKGTTPSMAKPEVAPKKAVKTQGAKKPVNTPSTAAPAQPKKTKTGSK
jgi:hypothetical protein